MNEKHFPNLELCKKLTDLGFPETEMIWASGRLKTRLVSRIEAEDWKFYNEDARCPSVSELLDEMPQIGDNLFSIQKWGANQYVCIYTIIVNGHFLCSR